MYLEKNCFSKAVDDFAYRCKWKCSSAQSYETYDKGRMGETAECGEESARPRDWSHKVTSTNSSCQVGPYVLHVMIK